MQFRHIGIQIRRHNQASPTGNIRELVVCRESCRLVDAVSDQGRQKLQDLCLVHRRAYHGEHFIHDIKDCAQACFLGLLHDHLDHLSLTLRTSHIQTRGITDTAVGCNLHAVQMISVVDLLDVFRLRRKLDGSIIQACIFSGFHTVIIHVDDLRVGHIHIQSAEAVNDRSQSIEIHRSVICDIQVKIRIQHGDRLLRTAVGVSRVGLGVGAVSQIQQCIPVYRYQLHFLGIIIDTGNDHGIAVFGIERRILISVVNAEKSVSGISGQLGSLGINGVLNFLIDMYLALVHRRLVHFIQLGIQLSVYIQTADEQEENNNLHCKQYLFFHVLSPYLN